MQRKNSEKRFHTAGARIVNSSKLPPDFFRPSRSSDKNAHFHLHHSQPHRALLPAHARSSSAADPLLITFHRSASHNKLEIPIRYSCGEGQKSDWLENHARKGILPPVRQLVEKQNNFAREFRQVKLMKIRNKNLKNNGWGCEGERQMLKL